MTEEFKFHGDDAAFERTIKRIIERNLKNGTISENDSRVILAYLNELSGTNQIGAHRKGKLCSLLIGNRRFLPKDYCECTFDDLLTGIDNLKTAKKPDGSKLYKQNTLSVYVWGYKNFFTWLVDNKYNDLIDVCRITKIRLPKTEFSVKTGDLPTSEEVARIIANAGNPRNTCFIAFMVDGAMRVGDVAGIRFRDIRVTDQNIQVNTNYKTGRNRLIPLYNCVEYFKRWLSVYPGMPEPDDFVFCKMNDKTSPLTYQGVREFFDRAVIRAGISRPMHPHLLRHKRITSLLSGEETGGVGMSEGLVKQLAWGGESSAIKFYNHLCGDDVNRAMAALVGIDVDAKSDVCSVCGATIPSGFTSCPVCQTPVSSNRKSSATLFERARELEHEKISFME